MTGLPRIGLVVLAVLLAGCGAPEKSRDAGTPPPDDIPIPTLDGVETPIANQILRQTRTVRKDPSSAGAWGSLADIYMAHGFSAEAAEAYDEALRHRPRVLEWVYRRAKARAEVQDLDAAAEGYREALELDPQYAPAYARLAEVLLAAGKLEQAAEVAGQGLERAPQHAHLHEKAGRIALARKDWQTAARQFEQAIEFEPRFGAAHQGYSQALMATGRPAAAMEHAASAQDLPRDPGMDDLRALPLVPAVSSIQLYKLGLEMEREDRMEAALQHYLKALEARPEHRQARFRAGLLLAKQNRLQEAAEHLERSLNAKDSDVEAILVYGQVLMRLGRLREAEALFIRGMGFDPNHAEIALQLGMLQMQFGRPEQAARNFRIHLEHSPGSVPALLGNADALTQIGRLDDAERSLDRARESMGDNFQVQFLGANLLAARGRFDEAQASYERILAERPNWIPATQRLSWLLATAPQDGIRDGKRALELAESAAQQTQFRSWQVLDALAAAFAETGQFSRAARIAQQAADAARSQVGAEAAEKIEARRLLYEQGTAYRDTRSGSGMQE